MSNSAWSAVRCQRKDREKAASTIAKDIIGRQLLNASAVYEAQRRGTSAAHGGLRRHTPFTRCIPGPHASRTNVNISSGWAAGCCGCNGIPSLEEAKAKAKAIAISLIIFLSWVALRNN
jgi:hypothetical protein